MTSLAETQTRPAVRVRRFFRDRPLIPLIVLLVALVAVLEVLRPGIVNERWIANTIKFAIPLAILASCQTLTMLTGGIDLSVGIVATISAFVMATQVTTHDPATAIAISLLPAILIGFVSLLAWFKGGQWIMYAMLGGFVFLAPLTCIGLYAISAQLERGQRPLMIRSARAAWQRHFGNEMIFALALLVIFLVWARAAVMVSVFFPTDGDATVRDWINYLGIGSMIGAVFAAVTFSASAFSTASLRALKTLSLGIGVCNSLRNLSTRRVNSSRCLNGRSISILEATQFGH